MSEIHKVAIVFLLLFASFLAEVALAGAADDRTQLPINVGSGPTADRDEVIVRKGDHLWSIAAGHLRKGRGARVDDSVISPYWRKVIAANRENLRSGDPDLIFPGEVVLLPQTPAPD